MKAWQVQELGEPSGVLTLSEVAEPTPGPGQLVVRVLGAAANFPDVLMCRGECQVRPVRPFTPGIEVCGEVVALGDGVGDLSVGDRVVGSTVLPSGGFAELAVMAAGTTFPAPASLDDAEASALFVGCQTGWFGLRRRSALQPGETLLVHAPAGGVGSAAVQLGKALGARVIGVVRGAEKAEVARGLGADVVYDPVGSETFERSTKCIAFEGRILIVGFAGGEIQSARLNHALVKNYSIDSLHWGLYATTAPVP